MDIYKIADLNIGVKNHSDFTKFYMKDYKVSNTEPDFVVEVTDEMIAYEKTVALEETPEKYYEITAVLRDICKKIVSDFDGFFLHCSCLMYKGEAYIFTAKSGTGKSTHTRLWREVLGEQVVMINDDKPIVRMIDGTFYIYGTPWNGKHGISNNIKAPIKAVYYLHQAKENKVERCDIISSLTKLLSQTVLPDSKAVMNNLLDMLEKMLSKTPVFDLYCNISHDAVHTVLDSTKEI